MDFPASGRPTLVSIRCHLHFERKPECRADGRGWQAISDLARRLGVRFAFHGHHHDRLDYADHFSDLGFQAHAVGYRGITSIDGSGKVTVIRPGDYDAIGSLRWEGDDE